MSDPRARVAEAHRALAAGDLVRDVHEVALPPLPSGAVGELRVGLERPGASLLMASLGRIGIRSTRPSENPAPDAEWIEFAGGLALLPDPGVDAARPAELRPGARIVVRPALLARSEVPIDATLSIFLVDSRGTKHCIQDGYPPHDLEFTGAWRRGTVIRQPYSLRVEEPLPPGLYLLAAEVLEYQSKRRLPLAQDPSALPRVVLGRYKVRQPDPDPPARPCGDSFGGQIALDGIDTTVTRDGQQARLQATLHWRALKPPSSDYTVFVHLVDEHGAMLGQHDGQPQGGEYPTSVWSENESVLDVHEIVINEVPASAKLRVGLYLLATGHRLPLDTGGDYVEVDVSP